MKVTEVNKESRIVTFQKDEMEFSIRKGKISSWIGRMPTPVERKKAIRQFYAITNV